MKKWIFMFCSALLAAIFFIVEWFKNENAENKKRVKEIHKTIEELKLKRVSLENEINTTTDLEILHHEVLQLHKTIVENYIK